MSKMKLTNILAKIMIASAILLPNFVYASDHVIKAGSRAFETPILYVAEGDRVHFSNMNSHNSVSVDGLIPDGATPWAGDMGENVAPGLEKSRHLFICLRTTYWFRYGRCHRSRGC